jgi:hypothetical protein
MRYRGTADPPRSSGACAQEREVGRGAFRGGIVAAEAGKERVN